MFFGNTPFAFLNDNRVLESTVIVWKAISAKIVCKSKSANKFIQSYICKKSVQNKKV